MKYLGNQLDQGLVLHGQTAFSICGDGKRVWTSLQVLFALTPRKVPNFTKTLIRCFYCIANIFPYKTILVIVNTY